MKSISIPSTITSAVDGFRYCDILSQVTLAEGLEFLPSFQGSNIKEITIPDSVKIIPDYAFAGTPIESIRLPNSLEMIGRECFSGSNLKNIEIPEGITKLDDYFFSGPMEEVVIPSTVKKLGANLFADCYNLKKVTINCDLPIEVSET